MVTLFWVLLFGIVYAYFLYPLLLVVIGKVNTNKLVMDDVSEENLLSVTILLPVHNEENVINAKLDNINKLNYPSDRLKVVIVSDGSSDDTIDNINKFESKLSIKVITIDKQQGKANALNQGLKCIDSDIVVFTDASIQLEENSIKKIIAPFSDKTVGCVSGEDHIPDNQGGEGLYGQYELFLRNKESAIHSIVGASGSFYAQRRELIKPFEEGLAPDFLSVLNTVKAGYRAITEPKAIGVMGASKSTSKEYDRKIRTILRGMTTLFSRFGMMNPVKYGWFSVFLFSHKLMRWLVPFFLVLLLLVNVILINHNLYGFLLLSQLLFYSVAFLAAKNTRIVSNSIIGKIPLFFTMVNVAILKAWIMYVQGKRQEVWKPTARDN